MRAGAPASALVAPEKQQHGQLAAWLAAGCVSAVRSASRFPSLQPLTRPPLQPLTAEELASAKAALEKLLSKGQTLNLKTNVRTRTAHSAPFGFFAPLQELTRPPSSLFPAD